MSGLEAVEGAPTDNPTLNWLALPVFVVERDVICVVCPSCAFSFDELALDVDESDWLTYTCPECGAKGRPTDEHPSAGAARRTAEPREEW